ncbi:dephospho-CoA kinase [Paenochrobactrum gallinarii]|uniref:Dephospho-CoA kinase n=1 Tax=Paenochrobactrum gallinarii TaxID=643673 RepID=A0A841LVA1_9HYPH|nr:dephospho-CoA kinase [Paenochrobactrum gallinarii]MBB6260790.1 dephospho-CoA kinase [Paenochrobactrum gallinarii]
MIIVGLTGSIGMGKSTAAKMFEQAGVPVYDADETVHRLYAGRASPLIEQAFPGTVVDGIVDRKKLAQAVLNDSQAMKKLEAIVHPLVHEEESLFLEQARLDREPMVVLDIPLLFEAGGKDRVDRIVVVSAPADVQRQRVLAREGMTVEKFESILSRQMSDHEKRAKADFIIDSNVSFEAMQEQIDLIIAQLSKH